MRDKHPGKGLLVLVLASLWWNGNGCGFVPAGVIVKSTLAFDGFKLFARDVLISTANDASTQGYFYEERSGG